MFLIYRYTSKYQTQSQLLEITSSKPERASPSSSLRQYRENHRPAASRGAAHLINKAFFPADHVVLPAVVRIVACWFWRAACVPWLLRLPHLHCPTLRRVQDCCLHSPPPASGCVLAAPVWVEAPCPFNCLRLSQELIRVCVFLFVSGCACRSFFVCVDFWPFALACICPLSCFFSSLFTCLILLSASPFSFFLLHFTTIPPSHSLLSSSRH